MYLIRAGRDEDVVIAGLLHDADYEQWPEDHPNRTIAWLRERGLTVMRGPASFSVNDGE